MSWELRHLWVRVGVIVQIAMVWIEMKRHSGIKIGWKRVKGNEIVQWGVK